MSRHRGFTLIELLVVVAIIASLIAILLPSLGKARDSAKNAACGSNQRQVYLGYAAYASAWGGYYWPNPQPLPDRLHDDLDSGAPGSTNGDVRALAVRYVGSSRVFYCPAVGVPDVPANEFALLLSPPRESAIAHYLLLPGLREAGGAQYRVSNEAGSLGGSYPLPRRDLDARPSTVLFADVGESRVNTGQGGYDTPYFFNHAGRTGRAAGANAAFGDGHVAWANGASLRPRFVRWLSGGNPIRHYFW